MDQELNLADIVKDLFMTPGTAHSNRLLPGKDSKMVNNTNLSGQSANSTLITHEIPTAGLTSAKSSCSPSESMSLLGNVAVKIETNLESTTIIEEESETSKGNTMALRSGATKTSTTMDKTNHGIKKQLYENCPICEKSIERTQAITHIRIHELKGKTTCKHCSNDILISKPWLVWPHVYRHCKNRSYRCQFCNIIYFSQQTFQSHLREHKVGGDVLEEMMKTARDTCDYKCKICGKILMNRYTFFYHLRRHGVPSIDSNTGNGELKTCLICKLICYKSSGLLSHQRRLHPDHPDVIQNQAPKRCVGKNKCQASVCKNKKKERVTEFQCSICQRYFMNSSELTRHRNAHLDGSLDSEMDQATTCQIDQSLDSNTKTKGDNDSYKCKICDKVCYSRAGLMCHLHTHKTEHQLSLDINSSIEDGFKCAICAEKNAYRRKQEQQMTDVNEADKLCDNEESKNASSGGGSVTRSDQFKDSSARIEQQNDKEKECQVVNSFNDESTNDTQCMYGKVETDNKKTDETSPAVSSISDLNCHICENTFPSQTVLQEHVNRHHVEDKLTTDVFYSTSYKEGESQSQQSNNEKDEQRNVQEVDQVPITCYPCHQVFHSVNLFQRHQVVRHNVKPFSCVECQVSFKCGVSLKRHMLKHSGQPPAYKCSFCGKGFFMETHLIRHERTHNGSTFSCNICGESRKSKISLRCHILTMHDKGEKPFKCSQCEKSFLYKYKLTNHEMTHSTERPYKCKICGEGFKDKRGFKLHQVSHTNEKKFSCSTCGSTFKTKNALSTHQVYHKIASDRPFQCTLCHKGFNHEWSFKSHNLLKHSDLPFECKVCKKKFAHYKSLRKHGLAHVAIIEKNIQCPQCPKKFRNRRHLRFHERRVHLKEMQYKCTICKHTSNNTVSLMYHISLHKCQICGKKYKKLDYVVNHMRVHRGERPFKCVSSCGKMFTHRSVLIKHQEVCQEKQQLDKMLAKKSQASQEQQKLSQKKSGQPEPEQQLEQHEQQQQVEQPAQQQQQKLEQPAKQQQQ